MLNKDNKRELCYIVKIDWVKPIENADNIELVGINAWTCIAKKDEFNVGDLAVYFEIDSKLPKEDWSAFMESKRYIVKTMKLNKFKVISQGLALPISAFGWTTDNKTINANGKTYKLGDFLTEDLGVRYSVEEDNKRKGNSSVDKYKKMIQRHPKVFNNPIIKKIYKTKLGKRILFIFFGKKKDNVSWLSWVVKTDEERIENLPHLFNSDMLWIATEKVDGTSATYTIKRKGKKGDFYVCSRNVVFTELNKNNYYYDKNVYTEMADKLNMESVLKKMLKDYPKANYITIQGEIYGEGIQKRDYGMKGTDFKAFNLIFDGNRCNSIEMKNILYKYNIPTIDILDTEFVMPNTIDELRAYVHNDMSKIDGKMREGIVFRSQDGKQSFKCVDPEYLIKYHG